MEIGTRRRMANNQEMFMQKLLRLAGNLPHQRYEIFRRLYIHGQKADLVRESMHLSEDQFEEERRALLRSLIRA